MAYITYKSKHHIAHGETENQILEYEGLACIFQIGNQRFKFALQPNKFGEQHKLIHAASGMVALQESAIRHEKNLALLAHEKINTREAARRALSALVKRVGEGKVLSTIMAAPVLNPQHN